MVSGLLEAPKTLSQEPAARVAGVAMTEWPQDLYIPPDALEIFLDAFEGPLDLLLYLIRRQNLDILDIPIAEITRQYVDYIAMMEDLRLELAAEYLVMAAMLAEIKSRMLLPRPTLVADEEEDPRAELVRRLQEYERFKAAAADLESMPRVARDVFPLSVEVLERVVVRSEAEVSLDELLAALADVMARAELFSNHQVQQEALSVRERMAETLSRLDADSFVEFSALFDPAEGRLGLVVTFLAILELLKESLIQLVQAEAYAPIYLKVA